MNGEWRSFSVAASPVRPICLCCASFCAARAKRSVRPFRFSLRCSNSEAKGVDDVSTRNRNLPTTVSGSSATRSTSWKRTTLRHRPDSLLNVSSSRKERLFTVELCQHIRTRRDEQFDVVTLPFFLLSLPLGQSEASFFDRGRKRIFSSLFDIRKKGKSEAIIVSAKQQQQHLPTPNRQQPSTVGALLRSVVRLSCRPSPGEFPVRRRSETQKFEAKSRRRERNLPIGFPVERNDL